MQLSILGMRSKGKGRLPVWIVLFAFNIGFAHAEMPLSVSGSLYSTHPRSFRDIPFRTIIRQQYDYSCGSAALATLLRYHYGQNVDEAAVFKAMYLTGDQEKIRKVGFSLLDMKRYLEKSGFEGDGYRMTMDEVESNGIPAITVISSGPYKHFVVMKGVRGGKVLVGDPALGLKIYSRAEFAKMWNGIVFLIHGDTGKNPAFNLQTEWTPWTRAPTSERLDHASLFGDFAQTSPIYQVMQAVP